MMKLKTIKTEREALAAIQDNLGRPLVEMTSRDGTIRSVRVGSLHITGSYGIEVSREVPHETESRYRVTAKVEGFEPRVEYFEDYAAASEFKRTFDSNVDVALDENVKVLIDASGKIVGEVDAAETSAMPQLSADLPF